MSGISITEARSILARMITEMHSATGPTIKLIDILDEVLKDAQELERGGYRMERMISTRMLIAETLRMQADNNSRVLQIIHGLNELQ